MKTDTPTTIPHLKGEWMEYAILKLYEAEGFANEECRASIVEKERGWETYGPWQIYETNGFEDYREELREFQEENETEWKQFLGSCLEKEKKKLWLDAMLDACNRFIVSNGYKELIELRREADNSKLDDGIPIIYWNFSYSLTNGNRGTLRFNQTDKLVWDQCQRYQNITPDVVLFQTKTGEQIQFCMKDVVKFRISGSYIKKCSSKSFNRVARVQLDNGMTKFYNVDRLPNPVNSSKGPPINCSLSKQASPEQEHKLFWPDDQKDIAPYVEELARSYRHKAFKNNEVGCYRLWAECVKNATGIVLREPRLSNICEHGVPRNITGNQFYGGQNIDILESGEKCSDGEAIMKLPDDCFAIRGAGFTRTFFVPRKINYCSHTCIDDKSAYFLYGKAGEHFLANLCFVSNVSAYRQPTLFNFSVLRTK